MLMRSKVKFQGQGSLQIKFCWKYEISVFWKVEVQLLPNLGQRCKMSTFICLWGQRSYSKVKVIAGQVVKLAENVKLLQFEKFKCHCYQLWVIDSTCQPLYAYGVKDHIPRSRVISDQIITVIKKQATHEICGSTCLDS